MNNKYVNFVSDEHLLGCIKNLHDSYIKAKAGFSIKKFYSNKVDTIKLTFDLQFNNLTEEELLNQEVLRQIDKSINNSIGTFHEEVLGGIGGVELGKLSGYDVKKSDNTLFADIKNKHNTMNSSSAESLFQKLARYADTNKKAKCYWVQILAKDSFDENWVGEINGKEYSHTRVYKISGDRFYDLLSGEQNSLFKLYKALPKAIEDYLALVDMKVVESNSVMSEINKKTSKSHKGMLDQITLDNFPYYSGFEDL